VGNTKTRWESRYSAIGLHPISLAKLPLSGALTPFCQVAPRRKAGLADQVGAAQRSSPARRRRRGESTERKGAGSREPAPSIHSVAPRCRKLRRPWPTTG